MTGSTLLAPPPPSPAAAYSYLIYQTGGRVYARNGLTGSTDYSGPDAATVINQAIAACAAGGLVLVAPGTYTLTHPIICDLDSVTLRGSGPNRGVVFALSSAAGNLFAPDPNTHVVTGGVTALVAGSAAGIIFGNTRNLTYGAVENITVLGNCYQNTGNLAGKPFDGIWMRGGDCNLSNVRVAQCPHDGVRVDSFDYNATTIYDPLLYNVYCTQNVNNQIMVGIGVSDWELVECRTDGGRTIGLTQGHGIYCQGGAGKVISCHSYFSAGYGFYSDRGSQVDILSGSWESNSSGGIKIINFSGGSMQRWRIIDAWIYANGVQDLLVHGVDYAEVRRVRCTSGTGNIRMESCTYSVIDSCTGQYDAVGITVDSASSHIDVLDNTLLTGGIGFSAASGRVLGNTLAGTLTIASTAAGVHVTTNSCATLTDNGVGTVKGTNLVGGVAQLPPVAAAQITSVNPAALTGSGTVPATALPAATATAAGATAQPFAFRSGLYYAATTANTTSASLGAGTGRVAPLFVSRACTINAIALEVTVAGTAGTTIRLGIWNDDGTGFPGVLLFDAGTIAGDAVAVGEIAINVALTPGVYWIGAAVQGTPATLPTVRVLSGQPVMFIGSTTNSSASSAYNYGYSQGSMGSALTNWGTGITPTGTVPKVLVKVA